MHKIDKSKQNIKKLKIKYRNLMIIIYQGLLTLEWLK